MQAIFLVGAVQALFLSILLLSKSNKSPADYTLTIWLIITGIPLILYYLNYKEYIYILNNAKHFPTWMIFVVLPFLLIQTPFLYLYVKSFVNQRSIKLKPLFLHFLPFTILIILTIFIYYGKNIDRVEFNVFDILLGKLIVLFFPITVISGIVYFSFSLFELHKYRKQLLEKYSYTENIDLSWLKLLVIIIGTGWFLFTSSIIILNIFKSPVMIHEFVLLMITILIFVLGYFGLMKHHVFVNDNIDVTIHENEKEYKKIKQKQLPDQETIIQLEKLEQLMETRKLYLENQLSISDLAEQMNIKPYQLSKLINTFLNKNFFDFINQYRVEEVKTRMQRNKHHTLLSIAYECGFNSKSAFNRIFKNHTGITPSQYFNQLDKKK